MIFISVYDVFVLITFQPIVLLHSMTGYWHHHVVRLSVCLSVCNAVYCGSHGRCPGLKVVPACS